MKKERTTFTAFLTAAALLFCAGCSGTGTQTAAPVTTAQVTTEDTEAPETEPVNTTEDNKDETDIDIDTGKEETSKDDDPIADEPEIVNIAALKGPTAMGLVKFRDDSEADMNSIYDFEMYAAPDELTPLIIQGKVDIACVPGNLASVLYNKTEGEVEVLAINTLGVLYIVENGGETINSVEDLKGKTIYASGQGSTPEYALSYILTKNGIIDDVNVEWKAEHAECLTALGENPGSAALLPQPFVTTAMTKNDKIRVALDLTKEWDKVGNGSSLVMGVVVGRKEFADKYPGTVKKILDSYKSSVEYVNTDNDGAAALVGKFDIVPEPVAKKALPNCNIVFISGNEMKEKLSGFLQVLF
ncbi:MAG: ABC transporter substrate-binding protein, partial [Ruminiclostridium sp.]|nr:ABC transporter substrate-binding protein [Ruminiclostridium sp.]